MKINAVKKFNFIPLMRNDTHDLTVQKDRRSDSFEKSPKALPVFEGYKCAPDNFKVKGIYGLPCPSCGQTMVLHSQVSALARNVEDKTGENLINTLSKYDKYYRPIEKEAVEEIKKMAVIYPDYNISQIVKILGADYMARLVNEQRKIMLQMKALSTNLPKDERLSFNKFIDENINLVKSNNEENHFARKRFLEDLDNITRNFSNPKIVSQIKKKAETIPTSRNNINAFFVKYSREDQTKIAERLLSPALATTEHIKPQSEKKKGVSPFEIDNTANFLAECGDCNSKRGNMPYLQWFKIKPDMPHNLQIYVNVVAEKINSGEIRGYSDYLDDITQTISNETIGMINLTVPHVTEDNIFIDDAGIERIVNPEEKRLAKIAKTKLLLEKTNEIYQELLLKKAEFDDDEEFQNILKYLRISQETEWAIATRTETQYNFAEAKKKLKIQEARYSKLTSLDSEIARLNEEKAPYSVMEDKYAERRKLKASIKTAGDVEGEYLRAQEANRAALKELSALRKEMGIFLCSFKLPENLKVEENALGKQISKINEVKAEIASLREKQTSKSEISYQVTLLKEEYEQRRLDQRVQALEIDFSDKRTKELVREYRILKTKLGYLSEIRENQIIMNIPKIKSKYKIDKKFILEEARYSLEMKLQQLDTEPVIRYLKEKEYTEKLKEEIVAQEVILEEISMYDRKIARLEKIYEELTATKSEETLVQEYEAIKSRRISLEEKFKMADIDMRIKLLESRIRELQNELKGLESK